MTQASIEAAAATLRSAKSALFITGAGMSADSGLPTYRGIGGLYNDVGTEEGIPIEVALSGHMMNTRPEVCWKYIGQVEAACRGALPNSGHRVIAELETKLERVVVLTQNVDGLHRAARSSEIIDIHGDVHSLFCTRCDHREIRDDYTNLALPPRCPACSGLVRPDVVLFGEMLSPEKVRRLKGELALGFDVVFSIGTTSVFPYIAQPFLDAASSGRAAIEINPTETEVSSAATISLRTGAASALEKIAAQL